MLEHNKKIIVYDAPMSYGKTTDVLGEINNNPDNFYFVFTPLLSEVDRYIENCPNVSFTQPSSAERTKTEDLEYILENTDDSVVTSHAMFENLTNKMLKSITYKTCKGKKVLVLDETVETVKPLKASIKPEDTSVLLEHGFIAVNEEDKRVTWVGKRLERYRDLWMAADNEQLYLIKDRFFVFEIPLRLIEQFDKVLILTYMFEGSVLYYYFKYYQTPFTYHDIDQRKVDKIMSQFRDLIQVVDCSYLKFDRGDLSKNHYNSEQDMQKVLNNSIKSVMELTNTPLKDTLYTMYTKWNGVDTEKWLKTVKIGNCEDCSFEVTDPSTGESTVECRSSFLSHTVRATNEYSHKSLMIYCINKYPHIGVQSFFSAKGVPMNRDRYALAEMLQWLFRGSIRERKIMKVAILNPHMQMLFQQWLDGDYTGKDTGLSPERLRTKMQDFNRWVKKNPNCSVYTFDEYIKYGGRKLKSMLKTR